MNSQDDAQFAEIDEYIRLQIGEAAAQLASHADTQAALLRVLRTPGDSIECDNGADAADGG
jgi:hypothetical protein